MFFIDSTIAAPYCNHVLDCSSNGKTRNCVSSFFRTGLKPILTQMSDENAIMSRSAGSGL